MDIRAIAIIAIATVMVVDSIANAAVRIQANKAKAK